MDRFKFWSRPKQPDHQPVAETPKRFDVQPRTDVGAQGLPADPDRAARLMALRRRRQSVLLEVTAAEDAASEHNRWRAQRLLLEQAIEEIDGDITGLDQARGEPGAPLPPTPVTNVTIETEPLVTVQFQIGEERFRYAEEIDWAERGFQLARSELHREAGDVARLLPPDLPEKHFGPLAKHLDASLFVYASDLRDRALEGQAIPDATLADLARPSTEHGGWLDWLGQSPIAQARDIERNRLAAERVRLSSERDHLRAEQEKLTEQLPFARRRLAEVDREIEKVTSGT
jgi:hypothetical protein